MISNKLKTAIELIRLSYPNEPNNIICDKVMEEFGLVCTKDDLNVLEALKMPDNNSVESRKIEYYGNK